MSQPILEIKNLHAGVEGKQILKGVDLTINAGEVHAIMGPNGSGKSTLAAVLAGRDGYEVAEGQVLYCGKDLLEMDPEERAREGVFLAFQYPVEIPGVNTTYRGYLVTAPTSINLADAVTGWYYSDANCVQHGFLRRGV